MKALCEPDRARRDALSDALTSHAAVVSRALGTPCVVGCGAGSLSSLIGQQVTVDGQSGLIYPGVAPIEFPDETQHPNLVQLIEWLEARAPLKVEYFSEAQHNDVYDLNTVDGAEEPDHLPALLEGKRIVRGKVVESDAGVAAALDAGVEMIVAAHRLPVMLAAWHHARQAK